jgi:hypothetical protein
MGLAGKLFIAVVLASLAMGGYYFYYLAPRLELPKRLISEEKQLLQERQVWVENRLAWQQLQDLDVSAADLLTARDNLLTKLKENIAQAKAEQVGDENYWLDQEKALVNAKSRFETLNSIWVYDPVVDLLGIEDSELTKRIDSAKNGLNRIQTKVSDQVLSRAIQKFSSDLDRFQTNDLGVSGLAESWKSVRLAGLNWVAMSWEDQLDNGQSKEALGSIDRRLVEIRQKLEGSR